MERLGEGAAKQMEEGDGARFFARLDQFDQMLIYSMSLISCTFIC
jgi:hypothetical protein